MKALARRDAIEIVTTRVRHAGLLADYYQRNEGRFSPWHPEVRPGHHSTASWALRLKDREQQVALGQCAHFILVRSDDLVATCSLTEIDNGQGSCMVGYSVDGACEGQGYMTMLLRHALDYGFNQIKLQSIKASYMPGNIRSARLLEKLGFEQVGYIQRHLYINGRWEDHVLASLANPAGNNR